jgi:glycosyltransferase involved in cell wall biosynthesis
MPAKPELSVVIPISERHDPMDALVSQYMSGLNQLEMAYELVFVLDGVFRDIRRQIEAIKESGVPIRLVQLARSFGEATALAAGIEHSSAELILTLPAYHQIDAARVAELLPQLQESGVDMVIAKRWPRTDSPFNRLQAKAFHSIFNALTGSDYHDLGCGVRAFRKAVATEVPLYGDQHRFFPVLAARAGFRVEELPLPQATEDRSRRVYGPGVYIRRLLDMLTMLFLLRFTKKPLRFFGLLGVGTFGAGGLVLAVVVLQRLFFAVSLADRPALLLSSLLVVLGLQLFALGLIGELIIFTHAKNMKEYNVAEVVNYPTSSLHARSGA